MIRPETSLGETPVSGCGGAWRPAMRSRQRYTVERPHQTVPGDIALLPASTMQAAAPGDIRLGVATGIWTVLGDLGADPDQVIVESGVDPGIFDDSANLISHAVLGRLYQHCAERTNCPHFGLLVGQKASLSSLGLVGMLMKSSDTLGEALRVLEAHLRIINRGAIVHFETDAEIVVLRYSVYEPGGGEGVAHFSDAALAAAVRVIRELCGTKLDPSEVLVPRRQPADLEPYRRVFRAPIRFNEEAAALVFPAQWLDLHVPYSDPAAHEALKLIRYQVAGMLRMRENGPPNLRHPLLSAAPGRSRPRQRASRRRRIDDTAERYSPAADVSKRDNPSRTASMRECGLSSGSASAASCSFTSSSRTQDSRIMRFS